MCPARITLHPTCDTCGFCLHVHPTADPACCAAPALPTQFACFGVVTRETAPTRSCSIICLGGSKWGFHRRVRLHWTCSNDRVRATHRESQNQVMIPIFQTIGGTSSIRFFEDPSDSGCRPTNMTYEGNLQTKQSLIAMHRRMAPILAAPAQRAGG